jgi:hypothetical protein
MAPLDEHEASPRRMSSRAGGRTNVVPRVATGPWKLLQSLLDGAKGADSMRARDSDTAKPELRAIQEAATTPAPQVVTRVMELIGDRLTCYIAGVSDVKTIARWRVKGDLPQPSARRLQIALQTALVLRTQYQPDQIAPWFTWLSDRLNDQSPASFLRCATTESEFEDGARALIAAAKAYLR